MLLIDVTIVNVALPSLALDLRASFTEVQWVVDVYLTISSTSGPRLPSFSVHDGFGANELSSFICVASDTLIAGVSNLNSTIGRLLLWKDALGISGSLPPTTTITLAGQPNRALLSTKNNRLYVEHGGEISIYADALTSPKLVATLMGYSAIALR